MSKPSRQNPMEKTLIYKYAVDRFAGIHKISLIDAKKIILNKYPTYQVSGSKVSYILKKIGFVREYYDNNTSYYKNQEMEE